MVRFQNLLKSRSFNAIIPKNTMNKTFVIGDIHGGLKALQQILQKAAVTADDTLIFLGDYVDGWSDSAATVSFLIELSKRQNCIFIRGNHDDLCYQWLANSKHNPTWLKHGGKATKDGYDQFTTTEKESHIAFYKNMKDFYILENKLFLHAGFTHMNGPEKEYFPENCYWDRTLWEMALAVPSDMPKTDANYPSRFSLFKEVYIGHTPVTRIGKTTPVNLHCVWNVDTGAAFKGPLTILDIESKEYWQSEPVWDLYPNEIGRN